MIVRPRAFTLVKWALLTVIVAFPLQAAWLYGHGPTEVAAILNKISLANWITIGVLGTVCYLAAFASPWLKFFAPIAIVVTGWNNYIVGAFHTDFSLWTTTLATMGFGLLFSPLLTKNARMILSNPARRWWLRPKRYKTQISATLNPFVGQTIHAQTFDISSGGAFIELAETVNNSEVPKVGERLRLSLNLSPMRKIRVDAEIVRTAEASGRYPKGIGVRFVEVEKDSQKNLNKFLNSCQELTIL